MQQKFFCTSFLTFLFQIVNAQLADSLSKKVNAIFNILTNQIHEVLLWRY